MEEFCTAIAPLFFDLLLLLLLFPSGSVGTEAPTLLRFASTFFFIIFFVVPFLTAVEEEEEALLPF